MSKDTLTTALDVLAIALVAAGVTFIYWPAGLIVAGLLLALLSWRVAT